MYEILNILMTNFRLTKALYEKSDMVESYQCKLQTAIFALVGLVSTVQHKPDQQVKVEHSHYRLASSLAYIAI